MKLFLKKRVNRLSGPSKNKRKKVEFDNRVSEIVIPNLVESDIKERWYGPQDYKRTMNHNQSLLEMMGKTSIEDSTEGKDCERGLEMQQPDVRRRSTANRQVCYSMVMQEQEVQRMRGVVDQQKIAEVYIRTSQAAKRSALVLGRQDEKIAGEQAKMS